MRGYTEENVIYSHVKYLCMTVNYNHIQARNFIPKMDEKYVIIKLT